MYFVSWIVPSKTPIEVGNATISIELNGQALVQHIISELNDRIPGAIILSINKIE